MEIWIGAMKRGNDELMPIVTKYIIPDHKGDLCWMKDISFVISYSENQKDIECEL